MGDQGRELSSCEVRCSARGTSRFKTGWQRLLKPKRDESLWARREPGHVRKKCSVKRTGWAGPS